MGKGNSFTNVFNGLIESTALAMCEQYTNDAYESICKGLVAYCQKLHAKTNAPITIISTTVGKAALRAAIELALSGIAPGEHVNAQDELNLVNEVIDVIAKRAKKLRKRGNNGVDPEEVYEAQAPQFDREGFYSGSNEKCNDKLNCAGAGGGSSAKPTRNGDQSYFGNNGGYNPRSG